MAPKPIHRALSGLRALALRLGGDRSGNVAIIFALSLPVIVMLALGGVDIHRITTAKAQFQDALDAATLAAARSSYTTPEDLKRVALANLRANLKGVQVEPVQDGDIDIAVGSKNAVIGSARGRVRTIVANIILPPYGELLDETLPISVSSQVNRSSRDVEVALALDITGSMLDCAKNCSSGRKIDDLKSAAKELIDIVVQTNQTPYYSKVALAPYSIGVNVGATYADTVRGPLSTTTRPINAVSWLTGEVKTVSNVSRSYRAVVTAYDHGFSNNDRVVIWGAQNMQRLNGVAFTVSNATKNSFTIDLDSQNYSDFSSAYSSNAYVAKCARPDCNIVITAPQHGLSPAGDAAVLMNLNGLEQASGLGFRVVSVSSTTATLALDATQEQLRNAVKGGTAYSSGGYLLCGIDGCRDRDFISAAGRWTRFNGTTCVSERTGSEAYSDAPPSASARTGRIYAAAYSPCPSSEILPLTNVKKTLADRLDQLAADGSTAGHIGLAWAWYLVSPNFGVWSGVSAPAPYDPSKTLKAVVLMSDGEFNTAYFKGVMASPYTNFNLGYINQPPTNGTSFDQAFRLCQRMKAAGIVIYTVGFGVEAASNFTGSIDSSAEFMARCASDPNRAFEASSSTDLRAAFRDIGRDIIRLRISR